MIKERIQQNLNDLTERYEDDNDESDKHLEARDRRYSCLKCCKFGFNTFQDILLTKERRLFLDLTFNKIKACILELGTASFFMCDV